MKKNNFFAKIMIRLIQASLLLVLNCFSSEYKEAIPQSIPLKNVANIIILMDGKGSITKPDDSLVVDLAAALYHKTAPIIVSNAIWDAFVKARNDFFKKALINGSPESHLISLIQGIKYYLEIYTSRLYPEGPLTKASAAHFINSLLKIEGTRLNPHYNPIKHDIERITLIGSYAYFVRFKEPHEWAVFENEYVHLLIPRTYESRLRTPPPLSDLLVADKELISRLDPREIKLGLKIYSMSPVTLDNPIDLPLSSRKLRKIDSPQELEKLLATIFLNKDDYFYSPATGKELTLDEKEQYIPQWIIYLSGHGGYSKEIGEIQKSIQTITKLHKELGFFRTTVCPTGLTTPESPEKQEYCQKCKELWDENAKLRRLISEKGGSIAGMSLLQFQDFLHFLQNKINTYFLYYISCYGAGTHLDIPYLMLGFPELYNFIIINAALAEAPVGRPMFFQIPVPPIFIEIMPDRNVTLKLAPHREFTNFFDTLNQEKMGIGPTRNFKTIVEYVQPIMWKGEYIEYIPLIRYPKANRFVPLSLSNKIKLLNRVTVSVAAKEGECIIRNKELALLYLNYIPIPIKIPATSSFPTIISMTPGQDHFIKEIEAPHRGLTEIIKGFFGHPKLIARKRFFIETINCANDLTPVQSEIIQTTPGAPLTLKNVIIDRNPPSKMGIKMAITCESQAKSFNIFIFEHIPQAPPTKLPPEFELITIDNKNYIITIKQQKEELLKKHRDFFAKTQTILYKASQKPEKKLFEIPQIPITKTRK